MSGEKWPEQIHVARYAGLMTFVSAPEEARDNAAECRTYAPAEHLDQLQARVEEVEQSRDFWEDSFKEKATEKRKAEQTIAEVREGIQERADREEAAYDRSGEAGDLDSCRVHGAALTAYRFALDLLRREGGE